LLGEPEGREGVKFIFDLATEYGVAPSPEDAEALGGENFLTGNYAMYWAQSGRFHNFLEAEFETDITYPPVSPTTGCRLAGSSSNFYTLTSEARYPDQAWRFMMWLGAGDADNTPQAIWARETDVMVPHIEANRKYWLAKHPDRNRESALASLDHQFRYPHCPPLNEASSLAYSELQAILTGAPFDEVLDAYVAEVDRILAENPTPPGWAEIWQENPDCI
jgi:ABC-type glycerol-3-phosphate transport system substrate-binding protein